MIYKEENKEDSTNEKKMCVIVKYKGDRIVQKEVLDLLLESSAGSYSIDSYISLLPSHDKSNNALFRVESFCSWLLKKCALRHDDPYSIDEYLHAMVEEWYNGKDNEIKEAKGERV